MLRHYFRKIPSGFSFDNGPASPAPPNMIWFISDTHFFHHNSIRHSNRPFADVEEMNARMVYNWNNKVKPNDVIYHLGDFSLRDEEQCTTLLSQLNGKKYLIIGNHDRPKIVNSEHWRAAYDMLNVIVDTQEVILCHFPFASWTKSHYGTWHLHGHCHGRLKSPGMRRADIGVDVWGYAPVSYDELSQYFLKTVTETELF